MTAMGRLHSVAKGRFWEAKHQRQLYGDEFGTGYFASRPVADLRAITARAAAEKEKLPFQATAQ